MSKKSAKLDALFANPEEFRRDRHMMVMAAVRGWLRNADQAHRDALMLRFSEAIRERETSGHLMESHESRKLVPGLLTLLEISPVVRTRCVDLSKSCTGHHYQL
jgi:hypothetical protein